MDGIGSISFLGGDIDRAANLRADSAAIAGCAADPAALSMVIWRGKPLLTAEDGGDPALDRAPLRLAWLPLDHPILGDATEAPVFLGLEGGAPRFASDISSWPGDTPQGAGPGGFLDTSANHHPAAGPGQVFLDLRASMVRLDAAGAAVAATARGVWGWHQTHGFCARCGAQTEIGLAGWRRRCARCGGEHFPRTDPVVIMLIVSGNRLLLGRSPAWPEGMYSLLAGFMEPGETVEQAVRREVMEETGITVGSVGYVASQPWPFPSSLMIGCWGIATSERIECDPVELEDARWVTRETLVEALAGRHPQMRPARKGAIARGLMECWLTGRLGPLPCS